MALEIRCRRLAVALFALAGALPAAPAADCNGNGREDIIDITEGKSQDCNMNRIPDECETQQGMFDFALKGQYSLAEQCNLFIAWPRSSGIVCADLNGDSLDDLVTANCGGENPGSTVSILFNHGDGTFEPEVRIGVGLSPRSVAVADFDGDGKNDIAVAEQGWNSISVLLNTGGGAFATPKKAAVDAPTEIAAADLDGDGDVDIAAIHESVVWIMWNDGSGQLAQGVSLEMNEVPHPLYYQNIALADIDNDGDRDVLASADYLVIWKNLGSGQFGNGIAYHLTEGNHGLCWTHALVPVDLNGDGYGDVLTADYTDGGTPSVSVLMNNRDGTLASPVPYTLARNDETQSAVPADFDADGDQDIACIVGNTLYFLANRGDGNFDEPVARSLPGDYSACLAAPDADGDGHPDLAIKQWPNYSTAGEADLTSALTILENRVEVLDANENGALDACEDRGILIASDAIWKYFRGTVAPSAATEWASPDFPDEGWLSGPTGIGFGDDDDRTILFDMAGSYVTVYCRKAFTVDQPAAIEKLVLEVIYDDGFIAYVNGVEVVRANMPSPGTEVRYDTPATTVVEPGPASSFDISAATQHLVPGWNVLAVEVHNASLQSGDLSFIPQLTYRPSAEAPASLAVTSGEVAPGATVETFVLLTSSRPVAAVSCGIAHDPAVADLVSIDLEGCPALSELNGGMGPDFFTNDLAPANAGCTPPETTGGTFRFIASDANPPAALIPAGAGIRIARLTYQKAADAAPGASSPLVLTGCLGDTPLVVTPEGAEPVSPDVDGGNLVIAGDGWFRRGDANADGDANIADAVKILAYCFGAGPKDLPCEDAGDTNDDGELNVADAIRLLMYLFAHSAPLPGPLEACGPDPTIDSLTCGSYERCAGAP